MSKLSYITRDKYIKSDEKTEPSVSKPGGGVVTKIFNIKKAFPKIQITSDINEITLVSLIDPLMLSEPNIDTNLEVINNSNCMKLLWCEEQAIFRCGGSSQKKIVDSIDALLACNEYQKQLLETIRGDKPVHILYTPIDETLFNPVSKKPQVVAMGKIGLQKNTSAILNLFRRLPADIHKVYIGNAGLWGEVSFEYDMNLERQMQDVADEYIHSATYLEVAKKINEAFAYVNMSIYDVGCLSFLESAMSGCYCYCWNYHKMFDEYENITRFDTVGDLIPILMTDIEQFGNKPNDELRKEMIAKHSLSAVKNQLGKIIVEEL